jgi:chromosome segregation ATPase
MNRDNGRADHVELGPKTVPNLTEEQRRQVQRLLVQYHDAVTVQGFVGVEPYNIRYLTKEELEHLRSEITDEQYNVFQAEIDQEDRESALADLRELIPKCTKQTERILSLRRDLRGTLEDWVREDKEELLHDTEVEASHVYGDIHIIFEHVKDLTLDDDLAADLKKLEQLQEQLRTEVYESDPTKPRKRKRGRRG